VIGVVFFRYGISKFIWIFDLISQIYDKRK